mgnify:CR=1 FL=1
MINKPLTAFQIDCNDRAKYLEHKPHGYSVGELPDLVFQFDISFLHGMTQFPVQGTEHGKTQRHEHKQGLNTFALRDEHRIRKEIRKLQEPEAPLHIVM